MTLGWDNPTADPTTTVLLRHGDTQLSPEHRFSGVRDLPLSASGTRQAKAAACRLATGVPIDAVVSSPLQRAAATAAIAAGELGLTAATDDDLRETDFGDWDGFTLEEIQQRWPAAAAAWRRDPEQAPPGGESFADTARRVNRACDRLLRDHGGQTVLVVSHVTPVPGARRPAQHPLPAISRFRLHQRDPVARPRVRRRPSRQRHQPPSVTQQDVTETWPC
jgi:probable phosphoglycerate mutase